MPFGRADPIPRVKSPLRPRGEAQAVDRVGEAGEGREGVSRDDGHPKWHPDQTLSVSWPFPFTLSVCVCTPVKKSELPQKREEGQV